MCCVLFRVAEKTLNKNKAKTQGEINCIFMYGLTS